MKTIGFCCISIWIFSQWHILFACYHTPKKQGNQWIYTRCHPDSFLFSTTCDFLGYTARTFLTSATYGGWSLHRGSRCCFGGENKMKADTLVVSRDWMGCAKKKKKSFTPSCENKCLDGWVTVEGAEKKWIWADRGRGIWHICLKLRPIRFRTNSRGALSLAFGQFMIAYTPHLGQKQNQKTIWKSIRLQQPVKLGGHPSNLWFVAALVFCSTSASILSGYSPYNLVIGDAYRIQDKTHNAQPS